MINELPTIGIIVIGRNEGERLKRCLRSLPSDLAVVYVDSASTDGSAQFAESHGADVIHLDLNMPFTAARARNAGLEEMAKRTPNVQFVQFIDGDCELDSSWLPEAIKFIESNATCAAVCGRRRERYPDASLYNRICDQEWDTPIGETAACGGDALFRMSSLRQCGFYDPLLIAGEEPELCHRLREGSWRIWRIDHPMSIHDADMHHFAQWWKRAMRSGFGYAQVWHKTGKSFSSGLYFRELVRAFGWTFGVPILGMTFSIWLGPLALSVIPALWLGQFVRLASRSGPAESLHLLLGKAAESLGALRYAFSLLTFRPLKAIYYK
ncbi:glycosyltransferase [Altererythrobacter sp. SALINAS58]|uniref:glycosyltransferase n=1 Tax=Alteripontixanthobacter muriae TaxID=2705546 RepID=UPI0015765A69|nr:glycosyltransferase [Alteripontixanthobacter muriae]NTZ43956.1 glycosyltransferase [Alteripontixanthobacter muriae]